MIVSIDEVSKYQLINIIPVKILYIIYKRLTGKYDKEDRHVMKTDQFWYFINPFKVKR